MSVKTFVHSSWTKEEYQELLDYLFSLQDEKCLEFNLHNIRREPMIGVRLPDLHKIARQIIKGNVSQFVHVSRRRYHETILLQGLVLAKQNAKPDRYLKQLKSFLPKVRNWAQCDYTAIHATGFRNQSVGEKGYAFACECVKSERPWEVRFGYVLLLSYYLDKQHIQEILQICCNQKDSEYFVNMAVAWLITTACPDFPKQVLSILKHHELDPHIEVLVYSKMRDSKRIKGSLEKKIAKRKAKSR